MNANNLTRGIVQAFLIIVGLVALFNLVMMAQSLSLYKTTLSEEDYSEMVASIIEKKDRIRTFASRNLH